ncbi:MAG: hypothetical protein QOF40_2249 [Actinomycetota bacterium]|jgi:hypothetical protein|nr:hypothetical protein [Actinomycetota bacterium]
MTELAAHGIGVTLPSGWEGRLFRRPSAGELSATAADGPPAPMGETTHAVLHVSTIALPVGVGDFASGAVDKLGNDDALIVLFEYDAASADQPLFKAKGIPKQLDPDQFNPGVLQRGIKGQAGAQVFFHDVGRAFCIYVVLGSYANRRKLVASVNQVLATLTIAQLDATQPTPSSNTTVPPSTIPEPTTTTPPVTEPAPTTTTTPVQP